MSQISHKKPGHFGPLNSRKNDQTVGQTYGERRRLQSPEQPQIGNLLQRVKDRFLGKTHKSNNINGFSNSTDRYLDERQSMEKGALNTMRRLEGGRKHSSAAPSSPQNPYTHFLESVITFFDAKKTSKKV